MEIKGYNSYYIENLKDAVLPLDKGVESNVYMLGSDRDFCETLFEGINDADRIDFTELNKILDSTLSDYHRSYRDVNLAAAIVERSCCLTMQMGSTRVLHIRPEKQTVLYDSRQQVLDIYSARAKMQRIDDIESGDLILLFSTSKIDVNKVLEIVCNSELSTEEKRVRLFGLHPAMSSAPNDATIMLDMVETGGKTAHIHDFNKKWYGIIAALVLAIVGLSLFALRDKTGNNNNAENTEATTDVVQDDDLRVAPDDLQPSIVHEAPEIEEENQSREPEREKEEVAETPEESQPAEVETPQNNDVPQTVVVDPVEPETPAVPDTPEQPEE